LWTKATRCLGFMLCLDLCRSSADQEHRVRAIVILVRPLRLSQWRDCSVAPTIVANYASRPQVHVASTAGGCIGLEHQMSSN
jgi:hypothetical protein